MTSSDDKDKQRAGIFVHKKIRRRLVDDEAEPEPAEELEPPSPPAPSRAAAPEPVRSGIMRPLSRRRPTEEYGLDPRPQGREFTPRHAHPVVNTGDEEAEPVRHRTDDFEDPFADMLDPFAAPLALGIADEPELEQEPEGRRPISETVEFAPPKNLLDFADGVAGPSSVGRWDADVLFPAAPAPPAPSAFAGSPRSMSVQLEPAGDFFDEPALEPSSLVHSSVTPRRPMPARGGAFDMFDPFAESLLGAFDGGGDEDDSILDLEEHEAAEPIDLGSPFGGDSGGQGSGGTFGAGLAEEPAWGDLGEEEMDEELFDHLDALVGDGASGGPPKGMGFGETAWASASGATPAPMLVSRSAMPAVSRRVALSADRGTEASATGAATAGFETAYAVDAFLALTVESGSARLVLSVGARPLIGAERGLRTMSYHPLTDEDWTGLVRPVCGLNRWERLFDFGAVSFFHTLAGGSLFKVTVVRSRGGGCANFTHLRAHSPTRTQLGLPLALEHLLEPQGGLVVLTAPPRHGKRTTLAAMVDALVRNERRCVIVVDDLSRFVFEGGVGEVQVVDPSVHATSTAEAIEVAVRSGADALAVAEPSGGATMRAVVDAASAGLLVLVTVDAEDPIGALDGMAEGDLELRSLLLDVLIGVVYQRQVRAVEGGRTLATACVPLDRELLEGLEAGTDLELLLSRREPREHCLGVIDAMEWLVQRSIATAEVVLEAVAERPLWAELLRHRLAL